MSFVAPTAAALLAAAGCSSDAPAPPEQSPTQHGGFAHCLSEHGVSESTLSPAGPPPGVDPATWDEAMQACASLAPGPATP